MEDNPYIPSYEYTAKAMETLPHATTPAYSFFNEPPEYTAMFYSPSEHEQLTAIKYSNFVVDYDSDLKEIHEALQGPPLEMYIPQSHVVNEGVGRQSMPIVVPADEKSLIEKVEKEISNEIQKLQQRSINITKIEVEEVEIKRKRVVIHSTTLKE